MRRTLCPIAVAVMAVLMTGCSNLQPWVKPYERERLAEPVMVSARDALIAKHRAHVFEVREAARGATGATGGGCGCN